ncbi:SGNH hydrolase [Mollisia scopiformis]|uniref:SGNH hydrolase n=1 Tax=Mollisia scopiformis TaxID=149040 RepID=A0A194X0U6_MOLSC|nr:SGNH hydrolase [Mollisia scopiformis]KUJ13589.1 SGNH hydrolase [Mollisia scopiformis]
MGETTTNPRHITALGSSYAAGPGIPPQINRFAGRSGNNFAHILASRLGAELTDLTVSGATLNNILSEPQSRPGHTFAPQIAELPQDTDVVLVTGGGNDMGYIGGVTKDALKGTLLGYVLSWIYPVINAEPLTANDVTKRFVEVIDRIREKAPNSRIYLVEYLSLLGLSTKPGTGINLTDEQLRYHQQVAEQLSSVYKLAAEARPGCEVVSVHEKSRDHGLGSKEPWVEGFSFWTVWQGNPFHPNLKGMQVVADMIQEKMQDIQTGSS